MLHPFFPFSSRSFAPCPNKKSYAHSLPGTLPFATIGPLHYVISATCSLEGNEKKKRTKKKGRGKKRRTCRLGSDANERSRSSSQSLVVIGILGDPSFKGVLNLVHRHRRTLSLLSFQLYSKYFLRDSLKQFSNNIRTKYTFSSILIHLPSCWIHR